MKKIYNILSILLFAIIVINLSFALSANPTQNNNIDIEQIRPIPNIRPVENNAGIWVVVTKEGYPLQNRDVELYTLSNKDISLNNIPIDRYKTDPNGLIYTRLKTGYGYKFVDVETNTAIHLQVDETFPQMVQLAIFEEVSPSPIGNSVLSISTRDNVSLNGIPFSVISIYDEQTGRLVLQRDTDESGKLNLRSFKPGNYTFTASARGYESVKLNDLLVSNGINNIDFIMVKADNEIIDNSVSVRIMVKADDENRKYIPFTEVLVYNEKGSVVYKDVTDATGFLYINSLNKGNYTFVFNAKGYQSTKSDQTILENTSLEILLNPSQYQPPIVPNNGKLKIQVLDNVLLNPMSLVQVDIYSYEKGDSVLFGSSLTDDFGIAYFEEIPLNIELVIRAQLDGYDGFKRTISFREEYNSLDVRLIKLGSQPIAPIEENVFLRIFVKDTLDNSLSRTNIEIISDDSRQSIFTDESGYAVFENLSSRKTYTLIVSKEGYESIKKTDVRFRENSKISFDLKKIDVPIENAGYIKVLVLDRETQTPLQNVGVSFTGVDTKTLYGSSITDEFGVAYFKGLPLNKKIKINANINGHDSFSREVSFFKEYDSFEVRLKKTDYSVIEKELIRQASNQQATRQARTTATTQDRAYGIDNLGSSVEISNIVDSRVYSDIQEDKKYYQVDDETLINISDFDKALQNNNISNDEIVSDAELVYINGNPTYIFQTREKRRLFNLIPMGEKIVYRAVSAVEK